MRPSRLIFEKVGDINYKYSYLCVYDDVDELNSFVEIGLTDNGKLRYKIYPTARSVFLDEHDWKIIQHEAEKFCVEGLNSSSDFDI